MDEIIAALDRLSNADQALILNLITLSFSADQPLSRTAQDYGITVPNEIMSQLEFDNLTYSEIIRVMEFLASGLITAQAIPFADKPISLENLIAQCQINLEEILTHPEYKAIEHHYSPDLRIEDAQTALIYLAGEIEAPAIPTTLPTLVDIVIQRESLCQELAVKNKELQQLKCKLHEVNHEISYRSTDTQFLVRDGEKLILMQLDPETNIPIYSQVVKVINEN